jgi:hypothetical protein
VLDPGCPSQALFGADFAGCCDLTGVCGLSTQPFAPGGEFVLPGFAVPLTCVTGGDVPLESLPFLPEGSAVPLRCGGAGGTDGSSGSGDQGAPGVGGNGDQGLGSGGAGTGSAEGGSGLDICPGQAIVQVLFDLFLEHLGASLDAADDASGDADGAESGPFDEGGEVADDGSDLTGG